MRHVLPSFLLLHCVCDLIFDGGSYLQFAVAHDDNDGGDGDEEGDGDDGDSEYRNDL